MDDWTTVYRIRVQSHLNLDWSKWFENMIITQEPQGKAMITGPVRDQAVLFGLLMKVRDLGLA